MAWRKRKAQAPLDVLLAETKNLQRQKWDWALPDRLLRRAYASLYLDIGEALSWVRSLSDESKSTTTREPHNHEIHTRGGHPPG